MVPDPFSPLVDREHEQRELHALLASGHPQLALLTGRRRIGKSYLLTHTFEPKRAFFFTAARTSPEINRRTLLAVGLMLLVAVVPALLMRPDRTAAPGPAADTVRMAPAEIAGAEPRAAQPQEQTPFEADVLEEAPDPLDQR